MQVVTVKLPDDWIEHMDDIANQHDTSRAAVMRSVVDNGLRAPKYYPDDLPIQPERYEQSDAVELAKQGRLSR